MASTPDPSTDPTGTASAGSTSKAAAPNANAGNASAKPAKAPKTSGRFTPKATKDAGVVRPGGASASGTKAAPTTGRYTPPAPREEITAAQLTKPWVPVVMFGCFILGLLLIVLNYIEVILPGAPSNWYLLGGIVAISVGFLTATQLY